MLQEFCKNFCKILALEYCFSINILSQSRCCSLLQIIASLQRGWQKKARLLPSTIATRATHREIHFTRTVKLLQHQK